MAIHLLCLIVLFALTLFSIITGNDLITTAITENYSYTQSLNGSTSELTLEGIATSLYLDPLIQAVIWISIIAGIIVLASLNILGSGLNESGSKWIGYSIFYISVWIILSTLSFPLIISIEIIGIVIYLALTITYAIGVIFSMTNS